MRENKDILNTLLNELLYLMGLNHQFSFHTITFKITETFNKNDLKKGLDTYIKWVITYLINKNKVNKQEIIYIYTYEVSKELHIHVHILFNQNIETELKDKLLKNWNEYNDWKWYNKRSVFIKNNNDYNMSIIELLDLEYRIENNIGKIEKELENAWILLKYITKDILNVEQVIYLNYILYPIYIINGSVQKMKEFDIIIIALQNLYKKNIYDVYNEKIKTFNKVNYLEQKKYLENPLLEDIGDQQKIKYIYEIWKKAFTLPKTEKLLLELFANLDLEQDLYKKQLLIEEYISKKQNIISELKLYKTNCKDFIYWNELLSLKINNKITLNENEYKWILDLEDKHNAIYYVLEGLIKIIRYFKNEIKQSNLLDEIEDLECSYTESYFKTIMREQYITSILNINIYKYQLLYTKKDKEFLIKIDEMIPEIKSVIVNKEDIRSFYKINQKDIEISLAKWIDLLLEILYEINIINRVNEISLYINDKKQNYFILSTEFLKYILDQEYMYEIIPPLLIKPKAFEKMNKEIIGGYYSIPNLLFSKNENLHYKVSQEIIDIINESQSLSLSINSKYLNYILNSKIETIQKLINLDFNYYIKNYLDKKVEEMKKSQLMFLIYEFFLSIYISNFYKKYDFWFITKLDERGRKYDVGYPLNFYRDKFFRNLFVLDKQQILKDIEIPLLKKMEQFSIYNDYLQEILYKETEYNIFHILENPFECLVGFDAKSQIYQIIGGLIKDKKLLELSKVLMNKDLDLDIYSYFLKKLKTKLAENIEFNKIIDFLNNYMLNNMRQLKAKIPFGIFEILEKLDRAWIKDIIMTYGYNKSAIELIITTDSYLFNTIFNNFKPNITNNKIKKISNIIINTLINDINEEIPTLSNLKLIFNSLIVFSKLLKNSVQIKINNKNVGFSQYYLNIENITFQKWRKVELKDAKKGFYWKKIHVTYPKIVEEKETKTIDFKKNLNALLPNTCHYLDSLLLYNTIEKIINLNIPIKTIHDSFYSNIKYKYEISNIYREQYIEIFKFNILEIIIKNALENFLLNDEFFDLISKLNILLNQYIPFTDIKDWKVANIKQLKSLNLNEKQKKLYKCLINIHKNYMIIYKNEFMQINFEDYFKIYKSSEMIL